LSSTEGRSDELLDKLILDVKTFVLLEGSDSALKERVKERLLDSSDDDLRRFVDSMQRERKRGTGQQMVVGIGELVLASILVLAGSVALIPTVVGINTPQGLLAYFSTLVVTPLANSPFAAYASAIEFLIGGFLLLAAFYTLRQAAQSLKVVGLTVGVSEE